MDVEELRNEDLVRKLKESEALVLYLRTVVESKDDKIAHLEQEMRLAASRHSDALLNLGEIHDAAIVTLKNEISQLHDTIERMNSEMEVMQVAARENSLLRAQIVRLKNDATVELKTHQDKMHELRSEISRVRASLATEFHTQLESVLREKTTEHLMALPVKAREALAEKELLRFQLANQDKEIFEMCTESFNLRKQLKDKEFELETLKEEIQAFSKSNAQQKKKFQAQQKRMNEILEENSDLRGQSTALQVTAKQLQDTNNKLEASLKELQEMKLRYSLLMKGMLKVCHRFSVSIDMFYSDPFESNSTQINAPTQKLQSKKSSGYGEAGVRIKPPADIRDKSGRLRKADGSLRFILPEL